MKLINRNMLIELGLVEEENKIKSLSHQETEISYDNLADQLYSHISDSSGIGQQELYLSLQNEGWHIEDIQIAISILVRKKLITYIGE